MFREVMVGGRGVRDWPAVTCLLLQLLLLAVTGTRDDGDGEVIGPIAVCQTDIFRATCGKDEVVRVLSAWYGRMRVGKCVETDYGHVGCQSDVFTETDRRCSGRHECIISVPDKQLDAYNACPKEFKTYFEATYKCIKVVTAFAQVCDFSRKAVLTDPEGFIANVVTEDTRLPPRDSQPGPAFLGVGSTTCPWVIHLRPGQRINITLHDFSRPTLDTALRLLGGRCPQYAVVTEKSRGTRMSERICGEDTALRHVYTSRSNVVEIRVISQFIQDPSNNHYFMLKYEAIGCAVPEAPEGGWVRQELNGDLTIACNFTDQVWRLRCKGNAWLGDRGNCSNYAPSGQYGMVKWGNLSLPYGVSVGIITGLAAIVGVIILLVGLICLEWNKMRNGPRGQSAAMTAVSSVPAGKEATYSKQSDSQRRYLMEPARVGTPQGHNVRDNEYAYVREMWPMAPPPNLLSNSPTTGYPQSQSGTPDISRCTPSTTKQQYYNNGGGGMQQGGMATDSEDEFHIYESPKPVRRITDPGLAPQYFELDPKGVPLDGSKGHAHQNYQQRDEGRATIPRPHSNVNTGRTLLDEGFEFDTPHMVGYGPESR